MGKASRRVHGPVTKQPPAAMTKKQLARGRKEARQLRIIWACVAAVGVLLLAVVAWAVIKIAVVDPRSPVAEVNGHNIPLTDYEPLLTYQRFRIHDNIDAYNAQLAQIDTSSADNQFIVQLYQQQVTQLQSMLSTVQDSTLDELIDDELIREKADEANLTVTSDEVSTYLHDQLAAAAAPASSQTSTVTSTAGITVTPTAIPQETLDQNYNNLLQAAKVSDGDFRRIIQRSLLRTKVQDLLASQVPTTGLIIHVQMIQIDVTPTITAALQTVTDTMQRIEGGADFATVAKEVSTLTNAKTDGGDLGWQGEGMLSNSYGTAVETLAFSLGAGQMGKVESSGKYYIVRVAEINQNGPLPDETLQAKRDKALTDWLVEANKTANIKRLLTESQVPPDPFASSGQTTG